MGSSCSMVSSNSCRISSSSMRRQPLAKMGCARLGTFGWKRRADQFEARHVWAWRNETNHMGSASWANLSASRWALGGWRCSAITRVLHARPINRLAFNPILGERVWDCAGCSPEIETIQHCGICHALWLCDFAGSWGHASTTRV